MNNTTNGPINVSKLFHTTQYNTPINNYAVSTLCGFIIFTGVIGNSTVIHILGWRKRKRRSIYELLLLLLAICGLLTSVFLPGLILERYVIQHPTLSSWDSIECQVSELFSSYTVTMTHVIIIIICSEKYRKITSPMAPALKRKIIFLWVFFGIILAVVITVPFTFGVDDFCNCVVVGRSGQNFGLKVHLSLLIYMALNVLRDVLALCTMALLTHKMLKALNKFQALPLHALNESRKRKYASARKMLITMIICFAICIIPHGIYFLAIFSIIYGGFDFVSARLTITLLGITAYFKILLAMSSVINPVIYSFMHPEFVAARKTIRSLPSKLFMRANTFNPNAPENVEGRV